ncbi:MAG: hypothetical protein Q9217_003942 [Psora testacea]
MSMRRLSPTANLLRTSRLFSIPPPLPRPTPTVSADATSDSDTSTLPYPIHAAIETTEPALGRGDWGLKRPLPLKSTTRTSTPHIYIENVDSIDHITDFGSAADHTRTLEKWQEMNLSLSGSGQNATTPPMSVFESDYDNTEADNRSSDYERWRFQGPWLAGQTHGEFTEYVDKNINKRRSEFREYLRNVRARALTAARWRELIESGENPEALEELGKDRVQISDEELELYIKHLRKNPEPLNRHIQEFLDLPRESQAQRASSVHESISHRGPPSTHPSAGLSYLRSHSHTINHPLYGPQENKPPVLARVLHPQADSSGYKRVAAILGIGGVVTSDSKRTFDRKGEKEGVKSFNPDIEGGKKLYVQLRKASISPEGHIELGSQRAEGNALYALGVDEGPNLPQAATAAAKDRRMPDLAPRTPGSSKAQGYGLESLGDVKKSERALPFSEGTDLQQIMQKVLQTKKPNKP